MGVFFLPSYPHSQDISPKHAILQLAKKNMARNASLEVFRCFNDFLNACHAKRV
jgi:hypothetical protein